VYKVATNTRQWKYLSWEINLLHKLHILQNGLRRIHDRLLEEHVRQISSQDICRKVGCFVPHIELKHKPNYPDHQQRVQERPKETKEAIFVTNPQIPLYQCKQEFTKSPQFSQLLAHHRIILPVKYPPQPDQ
jgi:hypothetical protein